MIKAIIFDGGGVITNDTDLDIFKDIAKSCRISLKIAKKALYKLLDQFQPGLIDEEEFWQKFKEKTNANLPVNYKQLWIREYKKKTKIKKEVINLIEQLKSKGYIIPLLSNTISPHVKYNRSNNLFKLFNPVILSCEVNLKKPDEKIYLFVLDEIKRIFNINIKPKECVFIDDRKENLKPAKKLGMLTIHYKNFTQLKKELEKII